MMSAKAGFRRCLMGAAIVVMGLGASVQAQAKSLSVDESNDLLDLRPQGYSLSAKYQTDGSDVSFSDSYSFTLAQESSVGVSLQVKDPNKNYTISGLNYSISGSDGFTTSPVSTLSATGLLDFSSPFSSQPSLSDFVLTTGVNYVLTISGILDGDKGGKYVASMAVSPTVGVSPVPLPAAFWFFATGLAGFIAMAKRRRSESGAQAAAYSA